MSRPSGSQEDLSRWSQGVVKLSLDQHASPEKQLETLQEAAHKAVLDACEYEQDRISEIMADIRRNWHAHFGWLHFVRGDLTPHELLRDVYGQAERIARQKSR